MKKFTALLLALLLVFSVSFASADAVSNYDTCNGHVFLYARPSGWATYVEEYILSQTDTVTCWEYSISNDGGNTTLLQVEEIAQQMNEQECSETVQLVYNALVSGYGVETSAYYEDFTHNNMVGRLYGFEHNGVNIVGVIAGCTKGAINILYINSGIDFFEMLEDMSLISLTMSIQ